MNAAYSIAPSVGTGFSYISDNDPMCCIRTQPQYPPTLTVVNLAADRVLHDLFSPINLSSMLHSPADMTCDLHSEGSVHSADDVDSVDYSDLYDEFNNGPRLYARGWLELDSLIPKAIVPATSLPNYFIAAVHAFATARSETASDNVSDRQTESLSDYVSEYSD